MYKICSKCNKEKPLSMFYGRRKNTSTHSWCKECNLKNTLERQRKFKELAVAFKGGKCEDCGIIDNPCIYDFHHLDPSLKDFTIAKCKLTKWGEKIEKELEKCILLCSNCHRKRHTLVN